MVGLFLRWLFCCDFGGVIGCVFWWKVLSGIVVVVGFRYVVLMQECCNFCWSKFHAKLPLKMPSETT